MWQTLRKLEGKMGLWISKKQLRLYRYRQFNCDDAELLRRTEEIFLNNKIFFPSPTSLNDPFDCRVHFDFSDTTKEEFRLTFVKAWKKDGSLTEPQIADLFEYLHASDTGELERTLTNSLQGLIDKGGVLSMSSVNDDILMWSHYTDGHRGYCFELDTQGAEPEKVKYRKRYQKFNLFNNDPISGLLTKPLQWKYEKEWRLFAKRQILLI